MHGKYTRKYSYEISNIKQVLNKLSKGNYYEKTQNKAHGSLAKNIFELEVRFEELLEKLDGNIDSDLAKTLQKKKEIEKSSSIENENH